MSGLVEVLAAHGGGPSVICDLSGWSVRCRCGHVLDTLEDFDQALIVQPDVDLHNAHVAAAVTDWLTERLASEEVREAVLSEWQRPEHAPMSEHDPRTGECVNCPWPAHMVLGWPDLATAALTAVTEALRGPS